MSRYRPRYQIQGIIQYKNYQIISFPSSCVPIFSFLGPFCFFHNPDTAHFDPFYFRSQDTLLRIGHHESDI